MINNCVAESKKNYFENKKISYYSNLSNMSESNFRKLFKEYTGKSFIEYRNILRINEAKKLIESNEAPIATYWYSTPQAISEFFADEIELEVGFHGSESGGFPHL